MAMTKLQKQENINIREIILSNKKLVKRIAGELSSSQHLYVKLINPNKIKTWLDSRENYKFSYLADENTDVIIFSEVKNIGDYSAKELVKHVERRLDGVIGELINDIKIDEWLENHYKEYGYDE